MCEANTVCGTSRTKQRLPAITSAAIFSAVSKAITPNTSPGPNCATTWREPVLSLVETSAWPLIITPKCCVSSPVSSIASLPSNVARRERVRISSIFSAEKLENRGTCSRKNCFRSMSLMRWLRKDGIFGGVLCSPASSGEAAIQQTIRDIMLQRNIIVLPSLSLATQRCWFFPPRTWEASISDGEICHVENCLTCIWHAYSVRACGF